MELEKARKEFNRLQARVSAINHAESLMFFDGETAAPSNTAENRIKALEVLNGVPDIGENTMIQRCQNVSTNFSALVPGEMLWLDGHAGVYIGGGLAIECTTAFGSWGVIKSAVGNIGPVSGYPTRYWTKHGKLPYVDYT